MIKFTKDKVLLLHDFLIKETGGDVEVRDAALLDSALESVFATFDGVDLYPSKEEKAARLGYALITNHSFVDGNKRIGMYIMLSFLELNGRKVDVPDEEIVRVGFSVADGSMSYEDMLQWIRNEV